MITALAAAAIAAPTWAGHQVTLTSRKVPILGTIVTRQDVFMIARVTEGPDGPVLVEQPCHIGIQSGRRVALRFDAAAVQRIPAPTIAWHASGEGYTGTWGGGWGSADVDGDGAPGFLVAVEAPVCGGSMSVATTTRVEGTAVDAGGGLDGDVTIHLDRDILSTSNPCLALVPKHTEDVVTGRFTYRPVADGATCAQLLAGVWPVRMDERSLAAAANSDFSTP